MSNESAKASQAARVAAGLCRSCGAKRKRKKPTTCRACQEKNSANHRRRLGLKAWLPGSPGRPPKWYTTLLRTKGTAAAIAEAVRRSETPK